MLGTNIVRSNIVYLELPFLLGLIYLIWFMPQAGQVVFSEDSVPPFGQNTMLFMAILSGAAAIFGWSSFKGTGNTDTIRPNSSISKTPLASSIDRYPRWKLEKLVYFFVSVAVLIQILIQLQPASALTARQPSGLITILRFFTAINPIALFLALAYFLRNRTISSSVLLLLALTCYAPGILLGFKRTEITELGVTILFANWAVRGWTLPRITLPIFGLIGLLVVFGVNHVRPLIGYSVGDNGEIERTLPPLEELAEVDWFSTITNEASTRAFEYRNGLYFIEEISYSGYVGGGRMFWNSMIQSWVPGQFVGAELKKSLMLDAPSLSQALTASGQDWRVGTTSTGFPEVYMDWNLFGAAIFFLMARITKKAFVRGASGSLASASAYPILLTLCISSFTHGGYLFFQALPIVLISSWIIRKFIKRNHSEIYV